MVAGVAGLLVTAGLIVVAVVWGRDGVEAVSWVAGVASLLVAVLTLWLTLPGAGGGGSGGRSQRFTARAEGNARVFQAGGDIRAPGDRPVP
jgi:hypothetical protein